MSYLRLKQGLVFHGLDESNNFSNRGKFLKFLWWYGEHSNNVSNILGRNVIDNNKTTLSIVQKDLSHVCATEITLAIVSEIGD